MNRLKVNINNGLVPLCETMFTNKRLAKFKLPKRVFVAKELPRNAMGKVQKVALSTKYRDIFKG